MKNRLLLILIVISCGLFLFEFIFTSAIHRHAADDFFFMQSAAENGIINGTLFQYSDYNSRFIAVLLIHSLLYITMSHEHFFLILGVFLIAAMSTSIFLLLQSIECRFKTNFRNMKLLALLICSFLFYSTIHIGEVWFWITSIPTNLLNSIIIITGASLLLHRSRRWYVIVGIMLCFAYAGNASELSIAFILPILILFLLAVKSAPCKADRWKITISILSFAIGFVYLIKGQGLSNRIDYASSLPWETALLTTFKYCGIILLKQTSLIIIPAICGILFIAAKLSDQIFIQYKKPRLYLFILCWAIFLFMYQFEFTLHTSDVAPARTLFPVMVLFIFSASAIVAPYLKNIKKNTLQIVVISIFILFQISHSLIYLPKTLQYVHQYDARMQLLKNSDLPNNEVLKIDKLPHSGLLYSAEITNDTSHFSNAHLKIGLQLNYQVVTE